MIDKILSLSNKSLYFIKEDYDGTKIINGMNLTSDISIPNFKVEEIKIPKLHPSKMRLVGKSEETFVYYKGELLFKIYCNINNPENFEKSLSDNYFLSLNQAHKVANYKHLKELEKVVKRISFKQNELKEILSNQNNNLNKLQVLQINTLINYYDVVLDTISKNPYL